MRSMLAHDNSMLPWYNTVNNQPQLNRTCVNPCGCDLWWGRLSKSQFIKFGFRSWTREEIRVMITLVGLEFVVLKWLHP
jgi:hypothetical protein